MDDFLFRALLHFPPLLIALTIHEYSHAYVAYLRGDDTAYRMGRLTLNPLVHLDPIGTLMLLSGFFGWAKPVPVNPCNLKDSRRDMVWISLAGPASNLILAIVIGLLLRFIPNLIKSIPMLFIMAKIAVYMNLGLAIFNLIPLAPLDGQKIVSGLLPFSMAAKFEEKMRHGPQILLGILVLGVFMERSVGFSPLSIIFEPWLTFWDTLLFGGKF